MENRIVDGVELLRLIRDGELKEETKLRDVIDGEIYIVTGTVDGIIREDEDGTFLNDYEVMDSLICAKFEILSEEDEEIDIDSIEEINLFDNGQGFNENIDIREFYDNNFEKIADKFKELIKAVKQINKKLEEK